MHVTLIRLIILSGVLVAAGCRTVESPDPAVPPAPAPGPGPGPAPGPAAAVEWTFLKAKPGKRDALRAFIIANWFAMDERAAREGLMRSYRLLDARTDDGPWDLAVEVEYFDERGYDAIKDRFEAIRSEHVVQPVDGLVLRDLGAVVGSRRLFPAAQGGAATP